MMSTDELQEKWKIPWPNLQDALSRLVFAGLIAGVLGFAGWALLRNGALAGFATFITVAGSSLLAGFFRPERKSFDDIDPHSFQGELLTWARHRPVVAWFVNPAVFRAIGAVLFGVVVVTLESWVHTWFSDDPANPSLAVTLITLAIVLTPAFTWSGYVAELRYGRSQEVDELNAIMAKRRRLAPVLSSPLGRAFVFAVIRTLLAIVLRVVSIVALPLVFNTEQATWAFACLAGVFVGYYDTISAMLTRGPSLLKRLHALTVENATLKEQVATLRAQVAVLQGTRSQGSDDQSQL